MHGVGLDYALNCVLRIIGIFSQGCEPEIEDDSRVVVAVRKRERSNLFKKGGAEDGGSR